MSKGGMPETKSSTKVMIIAGRDAIFNDYPIHNYVKAMIIDGRV